MSADPLVNDSADSTVDGDVELIPIDFNMVGGVVDVLMCRQPGLARLSDS